MIFKEDGIAYFTGMKYYFDAKNANNIVSILLDIKIALTLIGLIIVFILQILDFFNNCYSSISNIRLKNKIES